MKRALLFPFLQILFSTGCNGPVAHEGKVHPEWSLDATIYELNTRQFTPEGTFNAASAHLDRLSGLGVDIIWVMPIQPIGVLERKGDLGSYYAIKDYMAVNPEFGTMADFRSFVAQAHSLGMKVILDWVANHTSPDAVWTMSEGWHLRDSLGNMVSPHDWTDVAKLDYADPAMRLAMIEAMKFWIREADIDGFRCDVASEVPVDFWNDASVELQSLRPDIFMLAEAELPALQEKAFDAYYAWQLHHIMNNIATGRQNANSLRKYFKRHDTRFPVGIPMLFTSNHDENSWNGTEFERMREAAPLFAALTYVLPGIPLIYNGQEVGFDRRLEFFTKDSIDWVEPNNSTALYESLIALRHANRALYSGNAGGKMAFLKTDHASRVFAFKRTKDENVVVAVFNLSAEPLTVKLKDSRFAGIYTDFAGGDPVTLTKGERMELPAWGYKIMTQ